MANWHAVWKFPSPIGSPMFTLHGVITLATIATVFLLLQLRRGTATDYLFLAALVFITLCGVITPEQAFRGFASTAVLTIGGLLVCAAGLQATGVLDWIGRRLLGSVHSERAALIRLAFILVTTSAFVLNTILVLIAMPVVIDWCRSRRISPSRLLIPISYLTILGGVCTLVGTSTNLVVNEELATQKARAERNIVDRQNVRDGQLEPNAPPTPAEAKLLEGLRPMRLFEIGKVGLPCAIVGTVVLFCCGSWLLPNTPGVNEQFGAQAREYLVELLVQPDCPLIGKSVEQAGLRNLPGLFLVEINRHDEVMTPVAPGDVIHSGDRLIFTGIVSTIVDLEKIPGLIPVADLTYDVSPVTRVQRHLTEVVLSRTCPLLGTTVREAGFRQLYGAAIVAVHRNGTRLTNKIGDIILEPGDTLLLQTRGDFVATYRDSRDFYLVSDIKAAPRRHDRAFVAASLSLMLIGWLCLTSYFRAQGNAPGLASTSTAAITVALLMIITKCLTVSAARSALNLPLLFTIGAALGLAQALEVSGAARTLAAGIVAIVGNNPLHLLIAIYLMTVVFTEMISNTAVAATMLPLAISVARVTEINPRPLIMAITLAASLSFLSPIGYQTNLMVMGPGNYKPSDYFRVGLPLATSVFITAMIVIPWAWPF